MPPKRKKDTVLQRAHADERGIMWARDLSIRYISKHEQPGGAHHPKSVDIPADHTALARHRSVVEKLIGKDEKSDRHKEFYKSDCFERNYLAIDISFVVTRGSYREDKQHARALLTFPFKLPGRVLLTGRDVGCCRHTEQTFVILYKDKMVKTFCCRT